MTRLSLGVVLASLSFAADPVYRESVIAVKDVWRSTPGGYELRFTAPSFDQTRHVRLAFDRIGPEARVRLNGHPLAPIHGDSSEFDASDLLHSARPNSLVVAGVSVPPRLFVRVTPRVFLTHPAVKTSGGRLQASVWVRNTLDNTVVVSVALTAGSAPLAVTDATVGPGVIQEVALSGTMAEGTRHIVMVLTKNAEAMEGAYRYEISATAIRQ
jgi:hypothetical protein